MNMNGLKQFGKVVVHGIRKNLPTILTVGSVIGIVGTAILSGKATLKAYEMINYEEFKREEKAGRAVKLSKKEIVFLTWKCYIPTAMMAIGTGAAMIGSNSINLKRTAAVASVLSLTESTLKDYQSKVIETIGEKKENRLQEEISQEKLDRHPLSDRSEVLITGNGESLCFEVLSSRYFKSDRETLRRMQNDLNHAVISGSDYVSVNDLYYRMGLESTKLGDDIGWNVNKMLEFNLATKLADNGQPCIVVDYVHLPTTTFRN